MCVVGLGVVNVGSAMGENHHRGVSAVLQYLRCCELSVFTTVVVLQTTNKKLSTHSKNLKEARGLTPSTFPGTTVLRKKQWG